VNSTRILAVLLAFVSTQAVAAPRFEEFPALVYTGQRAGVQLRDAQSREYASALRAASRQPVNFAGRYVLTTWGCGASCVMGAAIDAKTGSVTWLPFTVCCWDLKITEPLEYRPDSQLLILHGSLDEKGAGSEVHYYDFDGRRFAPIKHAP
jgi:hypothetical protein